MWEGIEMLELTALAVSAVTTLNMRGSLAPGEAIEVIWRHYCYDPDDVWFLEVHRVRSHHFTERQTVLAR